MFKSAFMKSALLGAMTISLVACGGSPGDPVAGDSSSDPIAKYIGSWQSDCYADSGASARIYADFTKASATSMSGQMIAYGYLGSSCSGESIKSRDVLTGINMGIVGQKQVAGVNADKFSGTSAQGTGQALMHVDGSILRVGDDKSTKDAEGYPSAFYSYKFTRR